MKRRPPTNCPLCGWADEEKREAARRAEAAYDARNRARRAAAARARRLARKQEKDAAIEAARIGAL